MGWSVVMTLVMLSLVASVGESYPFSTLSIFDRYTTGQSRVLVRGADGRVTRVTAFDRWRCVRRVTRADVAEAVARTGGSATYLDRGSLLFVDGHQGDPLEGVPVEIVLRTLRFDPSLDTPEVEDVVLAACQADFVGEKWEIVKIWTIVRR